MVRHSSTPSETEGEKRAACSPDETPKSALNRWTCWRARKRELLFDGLGFVWISYSVSCGVGM